MRIETMRNETNDLGVELDEGGRLGRVRRVRVRACEDGLSSEQLLVGNEDLLASPLDRIDPANGESQSLFSLRMRSLASLLAEES